MDFVSVALMSRCCISSSGTRNDCMHCGGERLWCEPSPWYFVEIWSSVILQQAREVGVIKLWGGGLTGIWKTCFFMTACEPVLRIPNGAEKGVKPVWAHDLKQGTEFWWVVFCQCAHAQNLSIEFLDLLKSCINSVTRRTFEIYSRWKWIWSAWVQTI